MQVQSKNQRTKPEQVQRSEYPHNTGLQIFAVEYAERDQPKVIQLVKRKSGFYVQNVLKLTGTEMKILEHLISSRQVNSTVVCNECGKVLDSPLSLRSHMTKSHEMRRKYSRL